MLNKHEELLIDIRKEYTNDPKTIRMFKKRLSLANQSNSCCHYCGFRDWPIYLTIDHVIPKRSGGTNGIENLLLSCKQCNNLKGHTSYEEFLIKRHNPNWVKRRLHAMKKHAEDWFASKKDKTPDYALENKEIEMKRRMKPLLLQLYGPRELMNG